MKQDKINSSRRVWLGGTKNKGLIFIISGPSGSGKTTLLEKVIKTKALKDKLVRSISFTTRFKRSGEKNARDYIFITEKQFKEQLRQKKILEWTRYLGYYYATPKDFIKEQLRKGKHIILCLDLKGALKIKRLYPGISTMIFVMPPSLVELRERIKKRCRRTKQEEVQKRLELARREMVAADKYDYCLINKNLTQVTKALKNVILNRIKIQGER